MTLTLQEISDRLEIQDLLVNYGYAMESHDWDALDRVFTEDAIIDYTDLHGTRGDVATTKQFMQALANHPKEAQYLVATSKVVFDGDTAMARTIGRHPCLINQGEGKVPHVMFCGIWYNDRFRRTDEGWRITERVVERFYYYNVPPELAFLEMPHTENCACVAMTAG